MSDQAGPILARLRDDPSEPQAGNANAPADWIEKPPGDGTTQGASARVQGRIDTAMASLALVGRPMRVTFMPVGATGPKRAERVETGLDEPGAATPLAVGRLDPTPPAPDADVLDVRFWIEDPERPDTATVLYTSRITRALARIAPVWLDVLRQRRTDRLNAHRNRHLVHAREMDQARVTAGSAEVRAGPPAARPTALVCLRWLDRGGAEAFALATLEAAARAGFDVVVTCDTVGHHHLLEQARRWAKAVYLLDEVAGLARPDDLFWRVLERHRPALLHIQHSALAYAALPLIRRNRMVDRVIDTNHILEHRTGGYVLESFRYASYIDRHHVVSHHLARCFVEQGRIDRDRVRVGKLYDLSRHIAPSRGKWYRPAPLQVAFVGRFTQQKRPFLFVEIAARLQRRHGRDAFRFTAVGSGEMRPFCERLAARKGLARDTLRFLPGAAGAADALAEAHVLLVPSDNEGLTLVAFEAIRAECLAISCDVGAQSEIVLQALLVRREPRACVGDMVDRVEAIRSGALPAAALLEAQRRMLDAAMRDPTGLQACGYVEAEAYSRSNEEGSP